MSFKDRVAEARSAAKFTQVITRDAQGRAKTLYVPGHDGRKYQVIVRRIELDGRKYITTECRMDAGLVGYKPCQGNGKTVCYHSMAAIVKAAEDGGYKVAFTEDANTAVALAHLGGQANQLKAHGGSGVVSMRIYSDMKKGLRGAQLRKNRREQRVEKLEEEIAVDVLTMQQKGQSFGDVDKFNEKWAEFKNEFARHEAEQERKAFESDPDYREDPR